MKKFPPFILLSFFLFWSSLDLNAGRRRRRNAVKKGHNQTYCFYLAAACGVGLAGWLGLELTTYGTEFFSSLDPFAKVSEPDSLFYFDGKEVYVFSGNEEDLEVVFSVLSHNGGSYQEDSLLGFGSFSLPVEESSLLGMGSFSAPAPSFVFREGPCADCDCFQAVLDDTVISCMPSFGALSFPFQKEQAENKSKG